MEKNKFELTEEAIQCNEHTLHRIKALKSFSYIKKGELGGFVESENNLSQHGECWIDDEAKVFDNAEVHGNAQVYGHAQVFGNGRVCDDAEISDNANVFDCAQVGDNAEICGNAKVKSINDYAVFKNFWNSGRYFTWTKSNDMWKTRYFYGTGDELIEKAYLDNEENGNNYKAIINAVKQINNGK